MTAMHTLALIAMAVQDTSDQVPYVARPGGPVDTSPYMWAGYAITAVIYAGYILLLLRRLARARKGRDAGS